MIYRGYSIVKAAHPTPAQPKREGKVFKANIASLTFAQIVIDLMVKFGRWEDRSK